MCQLISILGSTGRAGRRFTTFPWFEIYRVQAFEDAKRVEQAGAELCQAQIKLEVIVDVVGEAWS